MLGQDAIHDSETFTFTFTGSTNFHVVIATPLSVTTADSADDEPLNKSASSGVVPHNVSPKSIVDVNVNLSSG